MRLFYHNTRSTHIALEPFDTEFERNLRRIRRMQQVNIQNNHTPHNSPPNSPPNSPHINHQSPRFNHQPHGPPNFNMGDEERTIRQHNQFDLTNQNDSINMPDDGNVPFELKSGLIHLLPSFSGLSGEDPNKHLTEFNLVCASMKPTNVTEEQIKLRAFPFSLKDGARD